MNIIRTVIGVLLGFILAGGVFVFVSPEPSRLALVQALGSVGILFSALFVAFTYKQNSSKINEEREWNRLRNEQESAKLEQEREWAHSKLVADAAITSLERAWEILTLDGTAEVPPNDRLTWLTAARNLLTAQELREKITDPTHALVFEEQLEYWRTRFYRYLEPLGDDDGPMGVKYFADDIKHTFACPSNVRQPIAEKSLAVVFRFIKWPEGREDRLITVEDFTEEELEHHEVFGHRGLARFIRESKEYKESLKTKS